MKKIGKKQRKFSKESNMRKIAQEFGFNLRHNSSGEKKGRDRESWIVFNVQKRNSNQIKSDEIRNAVSTDIFIPSCFPPAEIQFDKKLCIRASMMLAHNIVSRIVS
jgi:hypothetical protein